MESRVGKSQDGPGASGGRKSAAHVCQDGLPATTTVKHCLGLLLGSGVLDGNGGDQCEFDLS